MFWLIHSTVWNHFTLHLMMCLIGRVKVDGDVSLLVAGMSFRTRDVRSWGRWPASAYCAPLIEIGEALSPPPPVLRLHAVQSSSRSAGNLLSHRSQLTLHF